jgi:hypothetical protein
MKNLYWENIKKKNKNKYHFNTKSKKKDFQCTKEISFEMVKEKIDQLIKDQNL